VINDEEMTKEEARDWFEYGVSYARGGEVGVESQAESLENMFENLWFHFELDRMAPIVFDYRIPLDKPEVED
jgi:hypothetical protein